MSQTIAPAPIRKTLTVRATPLKAFEVFTDGFDRWWPRTHTIGAAPLKKAVIEPRAGGRWYGVNADDSVSEWGDVLAWDPPGRLVLAWRITGQWGYDPNLLTEIDVRFTDAGNGETRVDFEHRYLERLGESAGADQIRTSMDAGWGFILDSYITALAG
jgi:uncharacterized protein YndB with AHSA1/START domain